MTYGWAILAVIIVIIILYSLGVFSPYNNTGYSVSGFSPFTVLTQECGNGALLMELGNSFGQQVEIINASILSSSGLRESNYSDLHIYAAPDKNFFLYFYNSTCNTLNQFYSANIKIEYGISTPAGAEMQTSIGYITGKSTPQKTLEFKEFGLPAGTTWSVSYGGETKSSSSAVNYFIDLGNRAFSVQNVSINGVDYYPTAFQGVTYGSVTYVDFIPLRDMFVANGGTATLSAVSTATNQIVTTITVSTNPQGVAVTPDGNFVYVTNHGNAYVSVVNTNTNSVVAQISVGVNPFGIAVNPDGSIAYSTSFGNGGMVTAINTSTFAIISAVRVGGTPEGIQVSPNSEFIYVAQSSSNDLLVLNDSLGVVATIPVGQDPTGVAISPDGRFAYVSNNVSDTVSVINLSSYTVIKTVTVGSGPEGIAAAPNGKTVYVTNHISNNLSVINTSTFSVITINTEQDPIGVSVNPNNKFVYVSNFNSNTVSVISTASNSVVDTITGFKSPSGIADAPSGSI